MNRKEFLRTALIAGVGLPFALSFDQKDGKLKSPEVFNMKFAPEFGIFSEVAGKDPIDQIRWGYDNGFRAWENTRLLRRPIGEQEKISNILQKLEMEFGQFVGTDSFTEVTFAGRDKGLRDKVLSDVRASVEVAKRMNTKFIHNVLGTHDPRLPWDFQMANAIELLKRVADIYEPHGLIMVMETMNHRINHPEMFLHRIPQAYAMAKAVGSPSVKILCDIYHVQIQEGNLIPTIDYAWDEIAYFQVGDTPGRKEPGTGEINYKNVFQHIYDKGYRGFLGMEHGIKSAGKEGALGAYTAYREVDPK
jgi:hydroxypyruvate isomerase